MIAVKEKLTLLGISVNCGTLYQDSYCCDFDNLQLQASIKIQQEAPYWDTMFDC